MTISSTTRKAGPYLCDGVQVAFPFAYKVFKPSDLYVVRTNAADIETVLVLAADYSVTLNSNQNASPGGTVTLNTAPAAGFKVTLGSVVPNTQPTDLTNQGGFYPKVITDALDRAGIQIQQLSEEVSRALLVPFSSNDDPQQILTDIKTSEANAAASAESASKSAADAAISVASSPLYLVDYSDLINYTGTSTVVYITGLFVTLFPSGISGHFVKTNRVGALHNGGTIIVSINGDVWERIHSESVNVAWFKAIGDWSDETLKLQAALNSLPNGGTCWLDSGYTYVYSSLNIPNGVTLKGNGAYASVLSTTKISGTAITLNVSSKIENVKLTSSVGMTGFMLDLKANGSGAYHCEFENYYIGVNAGVLTGTIVVSPEVKDCNFRNPLFTAGSGAAQFINFSNAVFVNNVASGVPGIQASFGVRFQNGDTAFVDNCNITEHGRSLYVDTPVGYHCYALSISNSIFDSAGTIAGGINVSSAEFNPAGNVFNTRISNCWFGLSKYKSGCSLTTSGAGSIDGIAFSNCEFTKNADCGFIAVGPNVKNWIVDGGFSTGNTNSGVRAALGTSDFIISGHKAGNIAGRGANNVGITVDNAASSNYSITGNVVTGNTTSSIVDLGTGFNARVSENVGYNGATPAYGVTVGASPWTYTSGHTPEVLYIFGGTVSSIVVDSTTVQTSSNATLTLSPQSTVQITYSAIPTVTAKRV